MSLASCFVLRLFLTLATFMEDREVGIGWPLGLGSMYMRLRLVESFPLHAVEPPPRRSLYAPSSTFTSFSSSDLDTESTVSFFQDNRRTLGRLIGLRPRNRRSSEMYVRNSTVERFESRQRLIARRISSQQQHEDDAELCNGICIPICLVGKTSGRKNGSN